jgi:hypothetical protein
MIAPPVLSSTDADRVNLAGEFTRVVPVSGNMAVCGPQFWLGPDRAGTTIRFWADATVVHLLVNGVRLKTVPSRLTTAHLNQFLVDGGRTAGPPPIPSSNTRPVQAIEVDRLVNATGAISLAGRQHPVGYHFAGRRVTVRIDRGVLQLVADGTCCVACPTRSSRPTWPASATPAPPDRHPCRHPSRSEWTDGSAVAVRSPLPGNASTSASRTPDARSPSKPPTPPGVSTTTGD